jgi:hypothetical protein
MCDFASRKSSARRSAARTTPQAYHKRRFLGPIVNPRAQSDLDRPAAFPEPHQGELGANDLIALTGRVKKHLAHGHPVRSGTKASREV